MDRFERTYKTAECCGSLENLHSNMDRFERCDTAYINICIINLHSNMDRFERKRMTILNLDGKNLHSNMDRFERATARCIISV